MVECDLGGDWIVDWVIVPSLCSSPASANKIIIIYSPPLPYHFAVPSYCVVLYHSLTLHFGCLICLGQWDASRCGTRRGWKRACTTGLARSHLCHRQGKGGPGWPSSPRRKIRDMRSGASLDDCRMKQSFSSPNQPRLVVSHLTFRLRKTHHCCFKPLSLGWFFTP